MSTNTKQGWIYIQKTHTLCTIHFEHTADRQGPWNAMMSKMAGEMKMALFQRVVMSLSWYTMLWTPPKFFWFCSWIYRKLLSSPLVGGFQ